MNTRKVGRQTTAGVILTASKRESRGSSSESKTYVFSHWKLGCRQSSVLKFDKNGKRSLDRYIIQQINCYLIFIYLRNISVCYEFPSSFVDGPENAAIGSLPKSSYSIDYRNPCQIVFIWYPKEVHLAGLRLLSLERTARKVCPWLASGNLEF